MYFYRDRSMPLTHTLVYFLIAGMIFVFLGVISGAGWGWVVGLGWLFFQLFSPNAMTRSVALVCIVVGGALLAMWAK
jgi:hypothetical protein